LTSKKTPLIKEHKLRGGRMVEFAGWELPVQYGSAVAEHHAVRERVGVFDVSHMGQLEFIGPDALALAQKVTCNDVERLSDGQAQYSAFLTAEGTFVDDIVVYRVSSERIFICVNAATTEKDFQWVCSHQEGSVQVKNRSDSFAQLAIQGPRAEEVLQRLTDTDLGSIPFYWFTFGKVGGVETLISRTGYTGEKGFEIYLPPDAAESVWQKLFDAGEEFGIMPAGLAARNTLRLEMCYPLYGNDIDEAHTPLEAGLGWIVKFTKDFVGKDVLLRQKGNVKRKLAAFEMVDPGIVRDGFAVYSEDVPIAKVTSGGFSPSLGKSVGLVYVPPELSHPGCSFEIDIRGSRRKAQVVKKPFLQKEKS
jgi:aminomethyltransferase